MLLTEFEPSVLWILSPTLYQLSHPVTPNIHTYILIIIIIIIIQEIYKAPTYPVAQSAEQYKQTVYMNMEIEIILHMLNTVW